jgi:hypothetical protein
LFIRTFQLIDIDLRPGDIPETQKKKIESELDKIKKKKKKLGPISFCY